MVVVVLDIATPRRITDLGSSNGTYLVQGQSVLQLQPHNLYPLKVRAVADEWSLRFLACVSALFDGV